MPDREQLDIICLFGLLAILYVLTLVAKFVIENWYVVVPVVIGSISLRVWWRRRYPLYSDDEDDFAEPVPQE